MKKINFWILLGFLVSVFVAISTQTAVSTVFARHQLAKVAMLLSLAHLIFLSIYIYYDKVWVRAGMIVSSFALLPSGYFTLIGLAKAQERLIVKAAKPSTALDFYLSTKIILGMVIINSIVVILLCLFVQNPIIKILLIGFISLGIFDFCYRVKFPVVKFYPTYLTLKYSIFKAARVVQYRRIVQVKKVNNSIVALTEIINHKPMTNIIAHVSYLENRSDQSQSILGCLEQFIETQRP